MVTILIDSCSYSFYRVTATYSWYKKYAPEKEASLENEEFLSYLESQYWKHLEKLSKLYNVPTEEMYLIRDAPISSLWRRRVLPSYKEKRNNNPSQFGQYIKYMNSRLEGRFKKLIRIDGAEADDIIATYVKHTSSTSPIVIIGNDSDYHQLFEYPNIEIIRPKNWEKIQRPSVVLNGKGLNVTLFTKVLAGDSSDEIPGAYPGCGQKTAEGLAMQYSEAELVEYLLELSKQGGPHESIYSNYLRNRELIDFNYIPHCLQLQILREFERDKLMNGMSTKRTGIQLGLCCLNTILREQKIFCSRKPILKTIAEKGVGELVTRCTKNAEDLVKMIEWNNKNGVRVFRISSEIFPHYNNPKSPVKYTLRFAQELLCQAGNLARRYGQRLTFHPGQYNVIASPNQEAWEKTKLDLDMHAEILDRLGCPIDSVMVIHAGGMYGDKAETKLRWVQRYKELPERVRRRLVLENCEKSFSIIDCLEVSSACGVPVVFDTHHYECYKILHPKEAFEPASHYIPMILETWNKRGIKPKFHISEQAPGGMVGKHSDFIEKIPDYILEIPDKYRIEIDLMVEAKKKEQAIFGIYSKYPNLDPRINNVNLTPTKKIMIKPIKAKLHQRQEEQQQELQKQHNISAQLQEQSPAHLPKETKVPSSSKIMIVKIKKIQEVSS